MATYSAPQFYADDYGRTLFPLKGNTILAKTGAKRISEHLAKCIDPAEAAHSFLPQQRVYASKQNWHLRRTVKLDVVSEYYIYDLLYRNRKLFRKAHKETRSHFGYRFAGGVPISPTESYKAFKEAISKYMKQFKYFLSLDIATYFNSIYHHDLVGWLDNLGGDQKDVESFGQFLREINAGRSVDCLPQGLYPTKMIGNDFLRFVDQSHQLGCSQLIRFMDDFYLFDDSPAVLQTDFLRIQALIGGKGLSVNPKKTNRLKATHIDLESGIDAIKKKLLDRRRVVVAMDYNDDGLPPIELKAPLTLSKDEMGYITDLLNSDVIDEEDAELILTVVRKGASQVEKRLPYFISNFPNLAKNVYTFSMNVKDKEFVAKALLGALKGEAELHEYQLFWMGGC